MTEDLFSEMTETLFEDKSILSEEYRPDVIVERDDEIDAYRTALKDVLFGRNPSNVFIYGKTGVGKTAVTEYIMNALQTEVSRRDAADELHVHFRNCNGDTVYRTVRALVNSIRGHNREKFPETGLSTSHALETLYEEMDSLGGTFLFVLDEIDHLSDPNTLLYELPRARSNGHLENARVGVIGISNNYTFRSSLSPKVKDTLMEKEIAFSPYDAGELQSILTARAEKALVDGACEESAIRLAAAKAAKDTGSARQAIDLLREGGDVAEEHGAEAITDSHIEVASERVQRGRVQNKLRDQTMHGQLILEAIARLEADGEAPVRSKEVQDSYERVAGRWSRDPLTTLKSIQNHLADLTMLGFLERTEQNEGRAGGVHYQYELTLDPEIVLETRASIETDA
ncbi:Orc1-type DNA replication protein [Natronomonas pharaonis DSM 2160]|uniref:ORC1-type DNA replication protein n=1 Tax=Natronomonas pharaonis (strain ATCC 35678 / DSM 2160 / CIP 103997 / JCM 8858 / NBRC 14720 / NCIMB 2260 / Gabara) TaxID=348780 RepID=A0A1U7EWZ3_NATPD|nr:orc1/cdc6 family replication initiation protein [Natronomonas pharaonis]CAI49639.1 Orc1-type DNA replication protein [Natronomonas pharaonis DSM 2160]